MSSVTDRPDDDSRFERQVLRKAMWRLLPFLVACYLVSFLDRVNVGFAALEMNRELGLSTADFGLGAGLFFLPYFLFEVPSNLALARFGASRWIARIMITWGVVSAAFAFIAPIATSLGTSNQTVFYALRFLLGAAEAGFFPGIIYYLTLWFPAAYRARVVALFMVAVPAASILGAPVSGLLLDLDLAPLKGWQWLFVIEAAPAVILGFAALVMLVDGPAKAGWLKPDERDWLIRRLDEERRAQALREQGSLLDVMTETRTWALVFIYFVLAGSLYAFSFFLPTIVKGFGIGNTETGLLAALPAVCGALGMVVLARSSDRTMRRRAHLCGANLAAAAGVIAVAMLATPMPIMLALCLAGIGILAIPPLFWPLVIAAIPARQAPAAIAAINALGNLAGFLGPYAFGALKEATGGFSAGFALLGGFLIAAALVTLGLPRLTERGPNFSHRLGAQRSA